MRPWLSGIMSPCQGLVGSSILPGRTVNKKVGFSRLFCLDANNKHHFNL